MSLQQPPPRHLLLIATQSDGAENKLDDLETAAGELHAALTDPAIGACADSPGLDAAHLRSGRVWRAQVDSAVRSAVAAAAKAGATLVLAFLGHGQVSAGGRLWYMAADSKDGQSLDCVDIAHLVELAADHPGVAGLVVLIDTCHAAAGLPDTGSLIGGFRVGAKKVAVLAACAAHERAFGLALSRRLAALLTEGLADEGELLRAGTLAPHIRDALDRQLAADFAYNGADGGLWLARNHQRARPPGGRAGALGAGVLAAALRTWPDAPPGPPPHTRDGLAALAEQAAAAGSWPVHDAADDILTAMDAATVLVELAGAALTTEQLRSLAAEFNRQWIGSRPGPVAPPEGLGDRALLQYLLEDAVVRAPATARYGALAWYLVAAAHACGRDPQDPLIGDWARDNEAEIALNDALARYAAHRDKASERRLVVSLDAAQIDWPDSLSVCVRDGAACVHHRHFACPPDQAGVERTLPRVIEWAESLPTATGPIGSIDLVVNAPVLLDWHPEEALTGLHHLGVHHTVALRWAGRLVEPGHLRGMNRAARTQLEQLRRVPCGQGPPVSRIDPAATPLDTLRTDLRRGRYRPAVLLTDRATAPSAVRDLVEAFLPYAPIVLWPRADTPPSAAGWECLRHFWDGLPARFGTAYRRMLTGPDDLAPTDPVTDAHLVRLAQLRTAWHDVEWLDFCARYDQHRPAAAPNVVPAAVPAPRST